MNDPKSFADDLTVLTNEVDDDVGSILHVVKTAKQTPPKPRAGSEPNAAEGVEGDPNRTTRRPAKPAPQKPEALENVTTRLSTTTNERLTEATLHQRLKKLEPNTRQGIIEVAVRDWLKRHDYDR